MNVASAKVSVNPIERTYLYYLLAKALNISHPLAHPSSGKEDLLDQEAVR